MLKRKPETNTGVIAALLHELLKRGTFATAADLKDAVKARCAVLRIPYDSGTIAEAIDSVERTRRTLPDPLPRVTNPKHIERPDEVRPMTREEASSLLVAWHVKDAARRMT